MKIKKSYYYAFAGLLLGGAILCYGLWPKAETNFQGSNNGIADKNGPQGLSTVSALSSTHQVGAVKPGVLKSTSISQSPLVIRFGAHPQPVSTVAGHPVEYPGQFARASVHVDGQDYLLTPNQLGNFPRISINPKDKVHVEVAYPDAAPGDPVVVETEDGGNLDGKKMANVTNVDGQQNVQFNFQATSQTGIYHISLRSGSDVKVLSFWAGAEPAVRQ